MAYFTHFSLNLTSSGIKKKKNILESPNPTESNTKEPSQQFLQQQLCWRLFAVPLPESPIEWAGGYF